MIRERKPLSFSSWVATGVGLGLVGYGGYVAATWLRYGRREPGSGVKDELMDRFARFRRSSSPRSLSRVT
jgi:hypothetical protein